MKTLQQAFSQANKSVGDEGFNTTQRAWYIDHAQMVLEDIAREVKLWEREKWYYVASSHADTSPPAETVTQAAHNFTSPDVITLPDYTQHTFAVQPSSSKSVQVFPQQDYQHTIVIPASEAARFVLRVTRGQYECKEFPYTVIQSALDLNRPFWNNDSVLSGLAFAVRAMEDQSLELFFAEPFSEGEGVYVSFVSESPMTIDTIGPSDKVPDWIYPALVLGIEYHLNKDFYNRGSDAHERRMMNSEKAYEKAKYQAIHYSRNMKNRRSTVVMQPIKWLSDTKYIFY